MGHSNRNFHKNCTKQKQKIQGKDIKELQKIDKSLKEYSTTVEFHEEILILKRIKT